MKKLTLLVIMAMISVATMAQMDLLVEVRESGTLEDVVRDVSTSAKYNTTSLKVLGYIDGRDMMFIRDMCGVKDVDTPTKGILKSLDLGDAFIVDSPVVYWSMNGKDYITKEGCFGCCFLSNCSKLEELILPTETTRIDSLALAGCSSLDDVEIPSSVEHIGYGAFYGCEGITALFVPDEVRDVGIGAFQNMKRLKMLSMGNGVSEIDNSLILGDDSLDTINFGVRFEKFNPVVFYTAPALNYIFVNEGNPYFSTFDGVLFSKQGDVLLSYPVASSMVDYIVPDGVKTIAPCAFYNSNSLRSVTMPHSLTAIDSLAFYGCKSLHDVKLNEGLKTIRFGAFGMPLGGNAALSKLNVPSSVSVIDGGAFLFNSSLNNLSVNDKNTYFSTNEYGMLFDKNFSTLCYVPCKIREFTIPKTVTGIGNYAFAGSLSLPSIYLNDNVETVGDGAFAYATGIQDISFGKGVKSVGDRVVDGCDNVKDIYWFANKIDDNNISAFAFEDQNGSVKQKCTLHVMPGRVSYYLGKKGFCSGTDNSSFFANVVQIDKPDSKMEIIQEQGENTYYNIQGMKSKNALKGLNIIQLPNGSSVKKVKK